MFIRHYKVNRVGVRSHERVTNRCRSYGVAFVAKVPIVNKRPGSGVAVRVVTLAAVKADLLADSYGCLVRSHNGHWRQVLGQSERLDGKNKD